MGSAESTQKLGERVVAAQSKLETDRKRERERYEYLKQNSPDTLTAMLKSITDSFETCSPFLESALLIAWMSDPQKCTEVVLRGCKKVLKAPIDKVEFAWFKQYVNNSSVWFFESPNNDKTFLYQDLLSIAETMSLDIVQSMDSLYDHFTKHEKWEQVQAIENQTKVSRQDDESVGLLQEKGIREIFEVKSEEAPAAHSDEMKHFIDSNLALNTLTSAASKINEDFQRHIEMVMSAYGDFQCAPMKKVERSQSKMEGDYADEVFPQCAKLLDLVRCSVTFNTVDQLLEGYRALMQHMSSNGGIVELARVKNGFINTDEHHSGYRDIKVNVIYHSQIPEHNNVSMICEVQLLLINYLQEKKRIHKLYSIVREETYFQMVTTKPQQTSSNSTGNNDVALQFKEVLNVGKEVTLTPDYQEKDMYKCSVLSELGLLGMEGKQWFGVVDMSTKEKIFSHKTKDVRNLHAHHWPKINGQQYLSVQSYPDQIDMFKVKRDAQGSYKFVNAKQYQLHTKGVIHYCEFDRTFERILLIMNANELQVRKIGNINEVVKSIKLAEPVDKSIFRNFRISADGSLCALGGGRKRYFYVIDIENGTQWPLTSDFLRSTNAPCFINEENQFMAIGGMAGKLEIWDVKQKKPVKELNVSSLTHIVSSTSTNNILAIGSSDKKLRLFDVRSWECFYEKKFSFECRSLHLTNDLKYLTCSGKSGDRCVVLQIE